MAHEYTSEATERCERALGTLMRGIGQPWRHKICLVGGLVPLYLTPGNDYAQPEHIGSTDVDVALRLVVEAEDEGAYSTLETTLPGARSSSTSRSSATVSGCTPVWATSHRLTTSCSRGISGRTRQPKESVCHFGASPAGVRRAEGWPLENQQERGRGVGNVRSNGRLEWKSADGQSYGDWENRGVE